MRVALQVENELAARRPRGMKAVFFPCDELRCTGLTMEQPVRISAIRRQLVEQDFDRCARGGAENRRFAGLAAGSETVLDVRLDGAGRKHTYGD